MKLAELTVTGFADIVSSDAPAPGGGSCAALYGAIGAALTAMVGGLTQGRKKYAEYAEHAAEVEAKGNELKTRLLNVMDRDTDAFNVVSAAFGMPKDTDEEKAARSAALQEATLYATQVPLRTMKTAFGVFEIVRAMAAVGNPNSVSDAGVGALAARSAVLGAGLNVRINAAGLKDRAAADALVAEADRLAAEAERAEREVLEIVASKI